jgi:hypothetical protein
VSPATRSSASPGGQQQLGGEVVVAFGDADGDLPGGAPVELGRPPRPRTGSPGQPLELDGQQALVGEPVEVERGGAARQPHRVGRLVPADRTGAAGHVVEQGAADGVVQGAHGCHAVRQRPVLHP